MGVVAAVDPADPGAPYPDCPVLALTGVPCPGCGGLRALHALTRGDVPAALALNPLVLLALPLAVVGLAVWLHAAAHGRAAAPVRRLAAWSAPRAAVLASAVAVALLVWTAVRATTWST